MLRLRGWSSFCAHGPLAGSLLLRRDCKIRLRRAGDIDDRAVSAHVSLQRVRAGGYDAGLVQWFVNMNPISHLVTAVRDLTNAGTVGWDLTISLVGAAVIVAIFAPITVRAYMRRT